MSKLIFGHGVDFAEPPADLAALGVQALALRGVRPGGLVDVALGPIDDLTALVSAFAVYLDGPGSLAPGPEACLLAAEIKGQIDDAALAAGGDATIQVAPAPIPGVSYWVQTILEIPD